LLKRGARGNPTVRRLEEKFADPRCWAQSGINMPFHFGQVFGTDDGRQAIVLHIRNDGQEGLVRFVDTRVEEWLRWDDFQKDEKWRWKGGGR
jgi:hypothetical protein